MRQIVEPCHDSLTQPLLFLTERLEFVILTSSSTVYRGWRRSVPARRQPLCHVSNSPQRLIHPCTIAACDGGCGIFSDHQVWVSHLFPSVVPIFVLARTSDKNVITMHRPRDGTRLVVKATTRHNANSETAADRSLPQLISP